MIIKYFAEDGTEFDNEEECLFYEKSLKLGNSFSDPRTKMFYCNDDKYYDYDFDSLKKDGFNNIDAFCVFNTDDMDKMTNIADFFGDILPWRRYDLQKNKFFGHWIYDYKCGQWIHFEECSEIFDRLRLFSYFPDLPNFSKIFHELGV